MKKTLFTLYLAVTSLSFITFSQEKISGEYIVKYSTKDFITKYTFQKNGIFTRKSIGDLGPKTYGKGHYYIKNDILTLNYDLTELKENSFHKARYYKNSKDSVTVVVNIYDFSKKPLSGILVHRGFKESKKTENGKVCFQLKKGKGRIEIEVLDENYIKDSFFVYNNLNYEIDVFLKKRSVYNNPVPLKGEVLKYQIIKLSKDLIELKKDKKKILLTKQ